MNIQIVKNKYVNALLLLMLGSAIFHILLLAFLALWTKNLYFLNYFNILSISYFIPNFLNSFLGDAAATLFALILYLAILFLNKTDNK